MSIIGRDAQVPPHRVVVVIDVIRAFTTAAVAFERGVTEIACAPSVELGRDLRRRDPDRLLVGEVNGLRPADFDFGNSPHEISQAPLTGRRLAQATSNGTLALSRCPEPVALLAASARNVSATARWITNNHADHPWTLICTGRTAEDWSCAHHLSALLTASTPDPATLIAGIMRGADQHAQAYARLPEPARVDLTPDLSHCCDVDRANFAMIGKLQDDHVVLTKSPC